MEHCFKEPINGAEAQAADFTNLGAVGGRICFHKNVNGMWMLRQCMTEWAAEIDWTVPELIEAAEHLPPPAALLNVDDPDLLLPGEMPARINRQLKRRGLQPVAEGAEAAPEMTSLILHSLAARYGEIVSSLAQITGKKLRRIYIVGGGSRNTLLNRLTADRDRSRSTMWCSGKCDHRQLRRATGSPGRSPPKALMLPRCSLGPANSRLRSSEDIAAGRDPCFQERSRNCRSLGFARDDKGEGNVLRRLVAASKAVKTLGRTTFYEAPSPCHPERSQDLQLRGPFLEVRNLVPPQFVIDRSVAEWNLQSFLLLTNSDGAKLQQTCNLLNLRRGMTDSDGAVMCRTV